ncbi:MAG: endonuclease VIII [Oscillospiraceae bacterium]|jgi:formamidopyrimidine-DNA glycosylase|nr:endonuclease VIII [Oscillospiraceae bacterium]
MIEIPEAITLAAQLNETVKGKTIQNLVADSSPHKFTWYYGNIEDYAALAIGKRVEAANAYNGRVLVELDGAELDLNDGAFPRYHEPDAKLPAKHQLLVEFTDGSAITATVAMYGGIGVYAKGGNDDNVYLKAAKEAVSPLSEEFDFKFFTNLLNDKTAKLSAKAFLATEQRIPGLGNGVLHDILLNANIHPKKKMNTLTDAQFSDLFASVKSTLREMTELGGRDVTRDLYGNPGGYVTMLSKNNKLLICPRCGGAVTKETYLGGSVYYCSHCQKL